MKATVNYYKAFGLSIRSNIQLPELKMWERVEEVDLQIELGKLTNEWSPYSQASNRFVVTEQQVLFHLADVGTYCIREGKKIIVSPKKDADEVQLRLYILGSCMGAILMQRHIFPLHGSAISINGKAYAIVGHSGAGKSTLASAFLAEGYQLLTDDIIPLSFSKNGQPSVIPTYPQQKLWQETLTQFGYDSSKYKPIVKRKTKFAIPVTDQFTDQTLPLAGIFELVKSTKNQIALRPLNKFKMLETIFTHTYRNNFIQGMNLREWHFHTAINIVNQVEIYRLSRPVTSFTANELVACIVRTIGDNEFKVN